MEIPLTQGKVTQIDPEDWPLVSHYTWHAKLENGKHWYAATSVIDPETGEQVMLKMHRVITGAGPGEMVDRNDNRQTIDNRRLNLRV